MIRRARGLVIVGFLLLGGSPALAQATGDSDAAAATVVEATQAVDVDQAGPLAASRMPPPATTRAYVHVFLAFSIAFLLLGGYVTVIGRQLGRLEDEIRKDFD